MEVAHRPFSPHAIDHWLSIIFGCRMFWVSDWTRCHLAITSRSTQSTHDNTLLLLVRTRGVVPTAHINPYGILSHTQAWARGVVPTALCSSHVGQSQNDCTHARPRVIIIGGKKCDSMCDSLCISICDSNGIVLAFVMLSCPSRDSGIVFLILFLMSLSFSLLRVCSESALVFRDSGFQRPWISLSQY